MSPAAPSVSVVMPVRNRRRLLPPAINSVLRQTFTDFELIVVDDASTDDTRDFVQGLADRRVRYLHLERHSGPAKARNAGIRLARAGLLAFQDSDDEWDPRKLERQTGLLGNAPANVGLVLGAYVLNEPQGSRTVRSAALEAGAGYGLDLVVGEALVTPLWLVRRAAIEQAGLFDESLRSAEDYDLTFRLSRVCRFRAVPEIVLTKEGHAGSLSANEPLLLRGLQTVLGRYPEFWRPYPLEEARMLCRIATLHQRAGSRGAASRALLRALRRQPLNPSILRRVAGHFAGRTALRAYLGPALLKGPRVMRAFARHYPRATFVQIGSNDGDKHDPLRHALARSQWRGIMVEPVPYVFERLRRNYDSVPRVALENVAITVGPSAEPLPFHYVAEAADSEQLPDWYDEIGSFRKDVLLSHADRVPGLEDRLVTAPVPCLSFDELCARHRLDAVDLIHMDTEGYDAELLGSIDLPRWRPALLIYEHKHLDGAARSACRERLGAAGYECFEEVADTWCADARPRDARHAAFLRAWRAIGLLTPRL